MINQANSQAINQPQLPDTDFGRSRISWQSFLDGLNKKSVKSYKTRIDDFIQFHTANSHETDLLASLLSAIIPLISALNRYKKQYSTRA